MQLTGGLGGLVQVTTAFFNAAALEVWFEVSNPGGGYHPLQAVAVRLEKGKKHFNENKQYIVNISDSQRIFDAVWIWFKPRNSFLQW